MNFTATHNCSFYLCTFYGHSVLNTQFGIHEERVLDCTLNVIWMALILRL